MSSPILETRFPNEVLEQIAEEAMIYQCVCPAQVAEKLMGLRNFFDYQRTCASERRDDLDVHQVIMTSLITAHDELERCLDRVLDIEGWDRTTYTMPEGLRRQRDKMMRGR